MKFVTNSTAHDVAVSLDWVRSITLHSLSKSFEPNLQNLYNLMPTDSIF